MWNLIRKRSKRPAPQIPAGVRIYAVGDIHGRLDLLRGVLAKIDADIARSPPSHCIEVFLGDYIDRGPASSDVLDRLIDRAETHQVVCLRGNHEVIAEQFLVDAEVLTDWRQCGGLETLLSYGIRPTASANGVGRMELRDTFSAALPASHLRFLRALRPGFSCGDFFFVHAGVKPGVPLSRQREHDMLWIRGEFLSSNAEFEKMIVHGHTPVRLPEFKPNRINIDTGAFATGVLTCLKLEGDRQVILE